MASGEFNFCLRCGATLAPVFDEIALMTPRREAVLDGSAIVAPRRPGVPEAVCLECAPDWREVSRLVSQDFEWQVAKENAIAALKFDAAHSLLEQQREARAQLESVLARLIGPA